MSGDGTPPRWLAVVNPVMRAVGRLGAPVTVLTLPGRRSGRLRRTPVSPMELDGARYLVAGYPSAQWVHNARAAGVGELAPGGGASGCGWSSWWTSRTPARSCASSRGGCRARCR
jgi:hypothetical protein